MIEAGITCWTAKRKLPRVFKTIQGKTIASKPHDPSIWQHPRPRGGSWTSVGVENVLRTALLDVRMQQGKQLKDLPEASGEAMLGLRARTKLQDAEGRR